MARARRWILRTLLGIFGLILVAIGALLLILANLEWGPVKRFAQGQARAQGLSIDYAAGKVTLGGLHLRDVRLLSPPADASLAPSLVSIGSIDGDLSPFSMRVDDLVIKDVEVTIVVDPDGTTSIDRLVAGMPPVKPKPVVALSQTLATLLPRGITANARVENLTVTLLPRGGGDVTRLTGLTATARLVGGTMKATIGPTELHLTMGKKEAVARLDLQAALGAGGDSDVTIVADLVKQDLSPELPPVKRLLDLALSAHPRPEEKTTRVKLSRLALLDGAATMTAAAELRDAPGGATVPGVKELDCRIDLVALSKAVPPAFGPLVIEAEPLVCSVRGVELGPPLKADVTLGGKIARLSWRDLEASGVVVDIKARPDGDALSARVDLRADAVRSADLHAARIAVDLTADRAAGAKDGWPMTLKGTIAAGEVRQPGLGVTGVKVALDGTARGPRTLDLQAGIDVERVAAAAAVGKTHLDVGVRDLVLADDALASTGTVTVRGKIAQVVQPRGPRIDDADLDAELRLGKTASASLELDAGRVAVSGLPPGPLHLQVAAPRIELDKAAPKKSHGKATVTVAYGASGVVATVEGSAAAFTWDLTGHTDRAGPARTIALASKGSYGARIEQDTTVDVGRLASGDATVRGARLHLVSAGSLRQQEATVTITAEDAALGKKSLGAPRLELALTGDLDGRRFDAKLKGSVPEADLHLAGEIDKARAVHWSIDGRVGKLGTLAAFLPPGPRWNRLDIRVKGGGVASGIVKSVAGGVPVLVADPLRSVRGKQSLELAVKDVHYRGAAEVSADVEALTVKIDAALGDPHQALVVIEAPELAATASGVNLAVKGLQAELDAALDRGGTGKAAFTVRAASIGQSAFASYPVRDLALAVTVGRAPDSAVKLHAKLDNPGAGTVLEIAGELDERALPAADAVPGRHSITLSGQLDQALDKLDGAPEKLRARGHLSVPFRVESGDLSLFLASATVKLAGVSVELPPSKLTISGADGELPIAQEIVLTDAGPLPVGSGEHGLYPQLRFGDQQPFLGGTNYLSVGKITLGERWLGPVAGNVRIDHDVIAIDQLEMGALDGKISGQTLIELRGSDTRVAFRGKVTGIRPSEGPDRLDAHAALTLLPYRLGLEGRVEIVRIGKQHLLDLLDVIDPYHADVAMNRVRLGLKVGYPKQVRLSFERGFAGMHIELGGLAGAVRIDDIRGIPIGPALQKYLAPVLEAPRP